MPPAAPPSRTIDLCATVTRPPTPPKQADANALAWPVGADPRYLVELRLTKLTGKAPFAVGDVVRFLIHSAARTFGDVPRRGELVCVRAEVRGDAAATSFISLERTR